MALQDLASAEIAAFGDGIRERLRSRVDFNYNNTEVPDDPEKRALWYWCALLGLLTYEASASAQALALSDNLRGATVLNRVLFEYSLRLRYYSERRPKGVEDLGNHAARFKALAGAYPLQLSDVTPEQFAEAFGEVEGEAVNRKIFEMVKVVVDNDRDAINGLYYWWYAMASMFTHGNEAAFYDLSRMDSNELPLPGRDQLDWTSTRLHKNDVLALSTTFALFTLMDIERISGRGSARSLLWDRFPKAMRALAKG